MGDKVEFCKGVGLGLAAGAVALVAALLVWALIDPDNAAMHVARRFLS